MNKRNKKGFTLIELMAVIAIIAILVSIMTPMITTYNSRANAATNAANMRSVKATVATMLVSGEIDPESGSNASRVYTALDNKIAASDNIIIDLLLEAVKGVITLFVYDNTTFYAEDGYFTIDGKSIRAPQSKAINVDGISLRKGTEMTLTFVKDNNTNDYNEIVITYDGLTIEAFAVVAADGDEAKIADIEHNFVDTNNDWICDICGQGTDAHSLEDIAGGLGSNSHICSDGDLDHLCDNQNCNQRTPCVAAAGSHFCAVESCGARLTDCNGRQKLDDTYHCCSICGENKSEHVYGALTDMCDCGAERPAGGGGNTGGC